MFQHKLIEIRKYLNNRIFDCSRTIVFGNIEKHQYKQIFVDAFTTMFTFYCKCIGVNTFKFFRHKPLRLLSIYVGNLHHSKLTLITTKNKKKSINLPHISNHLGIKQSNVIAYQSPIKYC